jgi:hypothetical protein
MLHSSKERRAQKQQRFAEAHGRKRGIDPNVVLTVTGVLLVVALVYLASAGPSKASGITEVTPIPSAGSSPAQIQIPLSDVSDGQAKFYRLQAESPLNTPRGPEPFVSSEEAAQFLAITRRHLLVLARNGIAGAYALGTGTKRRVWVFRLSELTEAIAVKKQPAPITGRTDGYTILSGSPR